MHGSYRGGSALGFPPPPSAKVSPSPEYQSTIIIVHVCTVDLEIFVLYNFCVELFLVNKFSMVCGTHDFFCGSL